MSISVQAFKGIDTEAIRGQESFPAAVRRFARAAITEQCTPLEVPRSQRKETAILLTDTELGRFQQIGERHEVAVDEVIAQLAYAYYRRIVDTPTPSDKREVTAPAGVELRSQQQILYTQLAQGIDAGRVVMLEGSTGVGKTRVLALGAVHALETRPGPVIMAVPTVDHIAKALKEWRGLEQAMGIEGRHPARVRIGKGQFVDTALVRVVLQDPEMQGDIDEQTRWRVLEWLVDGHCAEPHPDGLEAQTGLAYLVSSLEQAAPDFPAALVGLSRLTPKKKTDGKREEEMVPTEPGEAAYLAHKGTEIPSLLFTTHAMLGVNLAFRRKGIPALLPRCEVLLVDEAHALEANIANVVGAHVSTFGLKLMLSERVESTRADLKKARCLGRARAIVKACKAFEKTVKALDDDSELLIKNRREDKTAWRAVKRFLHQIQPDLAFIGARQSRLSKPFAQLAAQLSPAALEAQHTIVLKRSRERRYPSIFLGPRSVANLLEILWRDVLAAGLVSATLYTRNNSGQAQSTHMKLLLNLPQERLRTCVPIQVPWVCRDPVLIQPDPATAGLLTPPKHDADDALWHRYYDSLARAIDRVAETAVGGTVVLLTSYLAIHNLEERLQASLGARLVVQRRGDGVGKFRDQFTGLADEGRRPLWLATGAAWTGMDIINKAVPANQDWWLTDLVIPRVPFSMPSNSTAAARARANYTALVRDAVFKLRQGMGRLMRREGTAARRLWVLDGRLQHVGTGRHRYQPSRYGEAANVLNDYTKREQVSVGEIPSEY